MTGRAFVALTNAGAGSAERETVEAACSALSEIGDCQVEDTETADDIDAVITDLDDRDLVLIGGDGSVHLAVARLDAAGLLDQVRLAIVPLGTGNDLARTLGLPLDDPAAAARVVEHEHARELDLLVVDDDRLAVNAAHAGIGAVAAERAAGIKAGAGPLAYPLGALSAGIAATGWEVQVLVDGEPLPAEGDDGVLMVAVGNGRTIGGGTELFPGADPGDGRAEVVVATALGPAARTAFGVALSRGTHLERDDVAHRQGREVRVTGTLPWNVDGELVGEASDRTLRVRAGAWRVFTPP